jgi:hypothetical protein
MPAAPRRKKTRSADPLADARVSLEAGAHFEAERLADDALRRASDAEDFRAMAHALTTLRQIRAARIDIALDSEHVVILSDAPGADLFETPGCWLLEPPLVGADGRRLREEAFQAETPALVVVREPETAAGTWPLVMIGPVTVRTYVAPPETIDTDWMLAASEALGEAAIAQIAEDLAPQSRVERLLERLQTLPDADVLHETLIEACLLAAEEPEEQQSSAGARRRAS